MKGPYQSFLSQFGKFTEIQELAIPVVKSGRNCLIISPTGTGKTEAAVLPVLERLESMAGEKGIFALYITPLRALNRDLEKRLVGLCKELGISLGTRHGDTAQTERAKQAANPPHLIVTTPETLQNLFLSPRLRDAMRSMKVVIVDELHELYSNKRGAQLAVALERIEELAGGFQRVGISATVGNEDAVSFFLFGKREYEIVKAKGTKKFEVSIEMPTSPKRRHPEFEAAFSLDDESLARIERVSDIINGSGATLVFGNTRQAVESLGSKLVYLNRLEGVGAVGIHHSSLDKSERIEIESSFKEGKLKGIIATSSLELGIDIGRIDHVVQYGSPRQAGRLIQRVGRGGHREGVISRGHIIVAGALEALESASAAISAEKGELEAGKIESNAADVLVNQITAISLEYRKVESERVYSLITRASPYTGLGREDFDRALKFASDLHLVRSGGGFISLSSRTRKYFFGNISVIPDSPRFFVKDVVRNRVISTLDESFVYNYLDGGVSFITKGVPWKVLSIEEDTVFVEPSADFESSVPDWEGEDIPVAYAVAKRAVSLIRDKKTLSERLDPESYKIVARFAELQLKHFLPGEEGIFFEELEDYIVVHVPLGKLANELLAKIVSRLIVSNTKDRVYIRSTPYALVIDCRNLRKFPDMNRVFSSMSEFDVLSNTGALENSELFRYRFVQVAKRFGVVEKKAAVTKSMANRLMEYYRDTIVYSETVRDLYKNNLDSEAVGRLIKGIGEGKILVQARHDESPLTKEILKSVLNYREFLSRPSAGDEELRSFEERFKDRETLLLCTFCGFQFSHKVDLNSEKEIVCRRCGSRMLATYDEMYAGAVSKKLSGARLKGKEREAYSNAIMETGMLSAYGDRAIAALLTYGVGLVTAARVLKMVRKDKKHFLKDLVNAQKAFVKNSRFWAKR